VFRAGALGVGLGLLAIGAYWLRPRPRPLEAELFRGVHYVREVQEGPEVAVVHTIVVTIGAPGLELFVTPGDPARALPLDARTPSQALREYHLQLVVNGDFFAPWYSNNALDYYPKEGDPVGVEGYAASEGVVYSRKTAQATRTVRFSRAGHPSVHTPLEDAWNAISGEALVDDGKVAISAESIHDPDRCLPRTAIGIDREERRLFLFVVDGRQANYSAGMRLTDLAALALRAGAWDVVNLDGGGSTALVAEGRPGEARQLNSPAHTRIPGRERPVANHFGLRAAK